MMIKNLSVGDKVRVNLFGKEVSKRAKVRTVESLSLTTIGLTSINFTDGTSFASEMLDVDHIWLVRV